MYEQLKADFSTWQSDDCPRDLRIAAAEQIAAQFPAIVNDLEQLLAATNDFLRHAARPDGEKYEDMYYDSRQRLIDVIAATER